MRISSQWEIGKINVNIVFIEGGCGAGLIHFLFAWTLTASTSPDGNPVLSFAMFVVRFAGVFLTSATSGGLSIGKAVNRRHSLSQRLRGITGSGSRTATW